LVLGKKELKPLEIYDFLQSMNLNYAVFLSLTLTTSFTLSFTLSFSYRDLSINPMIQLLCSENISIKIKIKMNFKEAFVMLFLQELVLWSWYSLVGLVGAGTVLELFSVLLFWDFLVILLKKPVY